MKHSSPRTPPHTTHGAAVTITTTYRTPVLILRIATMAFYFLTVLCAISRCSQDRSGHMWQRQVQSGECVVPDAACRCASERFACRGRPRDEAHRRLQWRSSARSLGHIRRHLCRLDPRCAAAPPRGLLLPPRRKKVGKIQNRSPYPIA